MQILCDRLLLREVESTDLEAFHAYQNDPSYLEHYPWSEQTREESKRLIGRFVTWSTDVPRTRFQLASTLIDSGEFIGTCGIRGQAASPGVADMGYDLDPRHWGHGYATEAVRAILCFAFEELGLSIVQAISVVANRRSIGLLGRLGFTEAERLPAGAIRRGYAYPERGVFQLDRASWNRPG